MLKATEQIKARLNITEVISAYVKLERIGSNWKGRCPFHQEKTPSFYISEQRQSYYCFGCGMKGDIFSFVEEFEKVDFKGALKILAEKAGVKLSDFNQKVEAEKDVLLSIMEETTVFFENNLKKDEKSKEYLKARGLSEETIKEWRLGLALDAWNSAENHLKAKGFKEKDIELAGIVKYGESGRMYDRFRDRLIFPLFDPSGRVVAYSGRVTKTNTSDAKYLNSPDTPLYDKSEILYGYHKAKNTIREKGFALLVEGQLDLLMCHQAGLSQAVATSGTALTEKQLQIIKRGSSNLMIAYDGDKAGIEAGRRAFSLALSLGFDVKIARLPQGQDPADVIKTDVEVFKNALRKSVHVIDFYLDALMARGLKDRALLSEVEEKVLPYVKAVESKINQGYFISRIAEKTGIREDVLFGEVKKNSNQQVSVSRTTEVKKVLSKKEILERKVAGMLFKNDSAFVSLFLERFGEALRLKLTEVFEDRKEELLFEIEKEEISALELLFSLQKEYLHGKLEEKTKELRVAEKEGKVEEVKRLLEECQQLTKTLSGLTI